MVKINTDFVPVDYDYFDFQDRNYIRIIGRNKDGKRICAIDSCDVYLWAILKKDVSKDQIEKLVNKIEKIKLDVKGRETKVESVQVLERKFLGRKIKALKIFATNYKDLHDIADKLDFPEIEFRRGYDLGYITHYIIEKKILPFHHYNLSGENLNNSEDLGKIGMNIDVDFCIRAELIKEIQEEKMSYFEPKVLAYDIETDDLKIGEGEILMVSLVGNNFKKVITWKKAKSKSELAQKTHDYVEFVKNEAELLEKFVFYVRKNSPDFLVGYFSDGFDLPYLRARAEKLGVKLSIGLDDSQPRFLRGGFGGVGTARTYGIVHIDLLKFIETAYSQYMQSETLSLNEVSNEFLGDTKKDFSHRHSSKIPDDGWNDYYEYNLHDSVLTFRLFEKMWPDLLEFSRVMQEPVFDVSRNGMSSNVEDYIIHNLNRFDEIPEKKPVHDEISSRRNRQKYEGAFVFEPTPGLYENVGVFDFTSFWPSIIVTFNLSKTTLIEKKEKDSISAEVLGKEAHFKKEPGFFPEMLKEIIEKRKKYKQELKIKPDAIKKARSNAFKLLANASYGYQGFFGARYYCPEASGAATAISRDFIKETIKKIDEQGYKTIYSDTDSIAFLMNKKTESKTLEFLKKLNSELPGVMELELEGFFSRGLWVTKRDGAVGAKKKYALFGKDGKMKIRGFETVRRDWCPLARRMQNKVLELVLSEGNEKKALEYIKSIIKRVKERKVERSEIIIKTMLQKPLSEYKAITPHVIAARKLEESGKPVGGGSLIEYFIAETREKKKLVRERVKLPDEKGEYNIEYYLDKQILPAVENIIQVFNIDINEIIKGKKQTKLGDF